MAMTDRSLKYIFCVALKFSTNYPSTSHQCPSPKATDQNYMKEDGKEQSVLLNTPGLRYTCQLDPVEQTQKTLNNLLCCQTLTALSNRPIYIYTPKGQ